MQEGQNARQQVVERIRQSTSILVAVGNNPSVDALAAALGLSLMLNKMNKHATAVFSGQTPAAIQFLSPNKTFENNVDALRDFIISLDKEKADRLRYKVEDDVVRIFITPYKTSISEKDLQYSQGDFNVDLIIALGVEKREDLDKAIIAHGRILHDATVITVNANNQRSTLGAIDFNDSAASSLCEMLVSMSEVFQQPGLLDAQISTALLTGIVAATERFSNPRTSPRVMTMAAQLMAAGANQQLIATNLEKAKEVVVPAAEPAAGPMAKQQASPAPKPMQQEPPKPKKELGELDIVHEKDAQQPPKQGAAPVTTLEPPVVTPAPIEKHEKELEAALPESLVQHNLLPELKEDIEAATENKPAEPPVVAPKAPGSESVNDANAKKDDGEGDYISSHGSWKGKRLEPPTLGGTLNATTEEAAAANAKAQDEDRNKKLLNHPEDTLPKSKRNRGKKGRGHGGDVPAAAIAPAVAAAATPALPAAPAPTPLPPTPEPVVEQPPTDVAPNMPPQPHAVPVPQPAPEPQPTPAPQFTPVPKSEPQPQPVQAPEPVPTPEPVVAPAPNMPPLPDLPPAPAPIAPGLPAAPGAEPNPEPLPPAPTPAPAAEPAAPITPATPAPNLEALHKEVADSAAEAAAAQPAENTAGDIDSARAAVSQALDSQPFDPARQPLVSVGAQPMPAMPDMPVSELPSPDALQTLPPAPEPPIAPAVPAPDMNGLPPLPPMPPLPSNDTALPPAPNLPGLNAPLPPIADTSPIQPVNEPPAAASPADPHQFQIPGAP